MKSAVVKRSVVISGHKTGVSLEDAFWNGLKEISKSQNLTLSDMVANIDSHRHHENLSSAIRLPMLGEAHAQVASTADRTGTRPMAAQLAQD